MSENRELPPLGESPKFLRPVWFFAGIVLGLVALSFAGWNAGRSDFHPGFSRFHPAISPEGSYYPTVEEMVEIVRTHCRPDQVLVIVGGNSILQGVAQPEAEMWTRRLQERLGDKFCVINFAFRGASPNDGGAVIAEVVRKEFPRQIYIANEKPLTLMPTVGVDAYRFLFWQAYFSGQLARDSARDAQVRFQLRESGAFFAAPAIIGSAWLERLLHFNVLWNRIAFTKFNTISSLYAPAPPGMFSPRRLFADEEIDGGALPVEKRFLASVHDTEMKILRAASERAYTLNAAGKWELDANLRSEIGKNFPKVFPPSLRARTLMLVGHDSIYYRRELAPPELERDNQAVADTVQLFKDSGYDSLEYGRDFTVADYHDRSHLTVSGGHKLAERVAVEVRGLSERLGYLK